MDFSAPHSGFVIASYVITAVVLLALVLSVWMRARRANMKLQSLEQRGAKRRRRASTDEGKPV